mmetsp:Transcript_2738/g.10535  ORF Transcript_2738/g.10535 Transcript_2738/m.10535 type:complete len:330 (-) Transcript_2738:4559-5548(-)
MSTSAPNSAVQQNSGTPSEKSSLPSAVLPTSVGSVSSAFHVSPLAKELIGGGLAGMAQVLVGHPLDLLKTSQQVDQGSRGFSATRMLRHIVKHEGIRGLYRGMTPPLASAIPLNIIIFSSSKFFKSLICVDPTRPTVGESWLAGLMVGAVLGMPLAPVEVLKCRLAVQANFKNSMRQYSGPMELAKDLYRSHGLRNGLFQGWAACTSREFCLSFYFAANTLVKKICRGDDVDRKLSPLENGLAGGAAGFAVWTCGYPIDVVKSTIQTTNLEGLPNGRRHLGMWQTAQGIYTREGIRGFTRGLAPCLIRGVLVNSVIFCAYDTWQQMTED